MILGETVIMKFKNKKFIWFVIINLFVTSLIWPAGEPVIKPKVDINSSDQSSTSGKRVFPKDSVLLRDSQSYKVVPESVKNISERARIEADAIAKQQNQPVSTSQATLEPQFNFVQIDGKSVPVQEPFTKDGLASEYLDLSHFSKPDQTQSSVATGVSFPLENSSQKVDPQLAQKQDYRLNQNSHVIDLVKNYDQKTMSAPMEQYVSELQKKYPNASSEKLQRYVELVLKDQQSGLSPTGLQLLVRNQNNPYPILPPAKVEQHNPGWPETNSQGHLISEPTELQKLYKELNNSNKNNDLKNLTTISKEGSAENQANTTNSSRSSQVSAASPSVSNAPQDFVVLPDASSAQAGGDNLSKDTSREQIALSKIDKNSRPDIARIQEAISLSTEPVSSSLLTNLSNWWTRSSKNSDLSAQGKTPEEKTADLITSVKQLYGYDKNPENAFITFSKDIMTYENSKHDKILLKQAKEVQKAMKEEIAHKEILLLMNTGLSVDKAIQNIKDKLVSTKAILIREKNLLENKLVYEQYVEIYTKVIELLNKVKEEVRLYTSRYQSEKTGYNQVIQDQRIAENDDKLVLDEVLRQLDIQFGHSHEMKNIGLKAWSESIREAGSNGSFSDPVNKVLIQLEKSINELQDTDLSEKKDAILKQINEAKRQYNKNIVNTNESMNAFDVLVNALNELSKDNPSEEINFYTRIIDKELRPKMEAVRECLDGLYKKQNFKIKNSIAAIDAWKKQTFKTDVERRDGLEKITDKTIDSTLISDADLYNFGDYLIKQLKLLQEKMNEDTSWYQFRKKWGEGKENLHEGEKLAAAGKIASAMPLGLAAGQEYLVNSIATVFGPLWDRLPPKVQEAVIGIIAVGCLSVIAAIVNNKDLTEDEKVQLKRDAIQAMLSDVATTIIENKTGVSVDILKSGNAEDIATSAFLSSAINNLGGNEYNTPTVSTKNMDAFKQKYENFINERAVNKISSTQQPTLVEPLLKDTPKNDYQNDSHVGSYDYAFDDL
jgi:hypothetical protein